MTNELTSKSRSGIRRPSTTYDFETVAIATHLQNSGMTITAIAKAGIRYERYDFQKVEYLLDPTHSAPNTGEGRRTALQKTIRDVRTDLLQPWLRTDTDGEPTPITFMGRPLPVPVALALDKAPQRGRPKKIRAGLTFLLTHTFFRFH